jgi:cellulose biosynthesis protein BcsQ
MELLVFSALEGLGALLDGYRDLAVLAPSRIEQVGRLIGGDRPPQALYLDDSREVPPAELWRVVVAAQQAQMRVLLNLSGSGRALVNDARGVAIPTLSERDPQAVAAWIGTQLDLKPHGSGGQLPVICVAAAKGGIGKTFATTMLAEGMRRRGLHVLVWDTDISNPGLVPAFRIPASAPSYLHLIQRGMAQWGERGLLSFIYQAEHTRANAAGWGRIDFLVGSHSVARVEHDVRLPDWQQLYRNVVALSGYDLLLIDTPPDYLRRPYATHALQSGGSVVLPCPPGARERMGVGHMLDHFREHMPDRLDACMVLFMQPERGVTASVNEVRHLFHQRYPQVRSLGVLPREPRLASMADENDSYQTMLDLGPYSPFAASVHRVVDTVCQQIGLNPPLPMPQAGLWANLMARLRGERQILQPARVSYRDGDALHG